MRYEDSDKLEVMLSSMINTCGEVGIRIQKRVGKVVKAKLIGNLNSLRTRTKEEVYTHMADDVSMITTKDKSGATVVKLQGGKKTGTLWHIVNDGSYNKLVGNRNKATHFMDIALNNLDNEIDNIIDEEMKKEGF